MDASDRAFEAGYYGKGAFGSEGYPDCIQKLRSEDCFYLNIWANAGEKIEKKPVMFWIHGGAYVAGSGSQATYCGANLVQAHSDIIQVNINYCLNMYSHTVSSIYPPTPSARRMEIERYEQREEIKQQIDYDLLRQEYPYDDAESMLELLVDVMTNKRQPFA